MKHTIYAVLLLFGFSNTGYGQDHYVLNKGIPQNNVCNLLNRLHRAVLKHHPSLVIIMIGTNDMVNPPRMLPYAEYNEKLNTLVACIKKSGADVLLLSLPGVDEEYLFTRRRKKRYTSPPNEKIDSANAIIYKTAVEQQCMYLDMHGIFRARHSPNRTASSLIRNVKNSWAEDGVHPTSHGYRVMGESIFHFLKSEGKSYDKIICFGDSITFGAYSRGQGSSRGKTYPAVLKKLLFASKH